MSMRTELAKVRGLGAAHDGTAHFWQQRLTAIFNLPLAIFVGWFLIRHMGDDRAHLVAAFKNPFTAVAFAAALVSFCWHMKLGLQMVIEDYVHAPATKLVSLVANNLYTFGLAGLGLYAILKMSLGA